MISQLAALGVGRDRAANALRKANFDAAAAADLLFAGLSQKPFGESSLLHLSILTMYTRTTVAILWLPQPIALIVAPFLGSSACNTIIRSSRNCVIFCGHRGTSLTNCSQVREGGESNRRLWIPDLEGIEMMVMVEWGLGFGGARVRRDGARARRDVKGWRGGQTR
eukprot:scaffold225412_cov32-Tisochrysis_lutea.AAC.2